MECVVPAARRSTWRAWTRGRPSGCGCSRGTSRWAAGWARRRTWTAPPPLRRRPRSATRTAPPPSASRSARGRSTSPAAAMEEKFLQFQLVSRHEQGEWRSAVSTLSTTKRYVKVSSGLMAHWEIAAVPSAHGVPICHDHDMIQASMHASVQLLAK